MQCAAYKRNVALSSAGDITRVPDVQHHGYKAVLALMVPGRALAAAIFHTKVWDRRENRPKLGVA